ncbi:hypothetical protein ABMA27_005762 [Loxostege sticticalis]|uniref:Tudor domain-containing protein 5 n=1 Tax=Loxostege sticticalis TaxID=481309 RepID=A0ABR3HGC9_LOXSC
MNKELEELKSVLRSLVVSSPTQVDVRSLLRDYRNMMGAPVPLTKYGYRDPVLFLRERFSDCFVFHGAQNNPILTLIVPDALRHIDEFVQRQKLSSTVKFKGKRTSIPEQVIRQPKQNLIASTFVPNKTNNNNKYNPPPRATPKTTAPQTIQNKAEPHKITNININSQPEREPLTKSMNKLNIQDKTISKESIDKNCSQSALQNFLKKRLPVYNSSQHIEKYDIDIASSKDDDSGRQTSSTTSSTKAALLEELKIEIRDLVAEHPEGVWCTDLIGLYRERYKRELNFSRFGYTSIISLVCVLEDVVHIQRSDDGKWLLRDARAAAAAEAARPRRYLPVSVARLAHAHHDRVDPDDALPGIDFDPDVFPTDCMHFMESIPAASLAELETGAMLEVILGEVYSPSHFWLLRLGERHHLAMEDMMDDMTKYYTYGEGKDRVLALGAVRVGHYCSSVFEGDWHRSLIVRIQDCDTVKVRHIDYGTVESVSVGALKPLRREWAALPAQAVRARLAGVRPPAAGRRWPHAASAHFLQLVRDTRLVANIVAVDREQDILEVFLIDTSTEDDVCISAQMVRSGHADARPDSALRTSECYLFPRFDALEAGATPNYGEIHAYLRDGIALEYVDEYRRHVPACLPPALPDPPSPSPPSPSPPAAPGSSEPDASADDEPSTADDEPAADHEAFTPDSIERPPSAPRTEPNLTRSASSPGGASPPHPAPQPPTRSASAHPAVAVPDAPLEVTNRIPLRPQCPSARPRPRDPPPATFHPPVRTPLPHAFSQMLPMPGYAGFPPFPGAVPLYPPMYAPPAPLLFPQPPYAPAYGPPRPCGPPPQCSGPAPSPRPSPPAPHSFAGPPIAYSCSGTPAPQPCSPAPRSCPMPTAFRPPAAPPASPANAPPPAATRPSSPPPPYNGVPESERARAGPAAGDVTLTVSECEIFRLLSSVDPNAAHWYMVDAISRAMRTNPTTSTSTASAAGSTMSLTSSLNPAAAEFRAPERPRAPLPPGMRPPPGFGF